MGKTIDELIENTKKNSIENALFNIVVKPDCEEELDKESLISPEIITGFTLNENSKTLRLIFIFYDIFNTSSFPYRKDDLISFSNTKYSQISLKLKFYVMMLYNK